MNVTEFSAETAIHHSRVGVGLLINVRGFPFARERRASSQLPFYQYD